MQVATDAISAMFEFDMIDLPFSQEIIKKLVTKVEENGMILEYEERK